MKGLISLMIFFSLLLWNCNEPNKKTAVASTDSVIKPTDTSHATPNDDSDDQELTAIVDDFKSQYNKNYNVDTTFTRGADSFAFADESPPQMLAVSS
jgi:hypothetical protein